MRMLAIACSELGTTTILGRCHSPLRSLRLGLLFVPSAIRAGRAKAGKTGGAIATACTSARDPEPALSFAEGTPAAAASAQDEARERPHETLSG